MGQPNHPLFRHWFYHWPLAVACLLIGCTTKPLPPVVKVVDNPEKDKYIARIEHEASEASAALKVAKDGVTPPHSKLVELTIVRLDGVKPPTQKQVDAFKATLGSTKELKKAEDKASKVEEDTDELWTMVDMVQLENQSLKEENEAIRKEQAFSELRATCFTLGSWFAIGGVLLLIGSSVLGLSKKGGLMALLSSGLCFLIPFVIQEIVLGVWMKIAIGLALAVGAIALAWEAYSHHKCVKSRLTSQPDSETQPVRVTGPQG
jgi:hypothetical protein